MDYQVNPGGVHALLGQCRTQYFVFRVFYECGWQKTTVTRVKIQIMFIRGKMEGYQGRKDIKGGRVSRE
jgi:hypothetical protein